MKKIIYLWIVPVIFSLAMTSCDKMLDADSERYIFDEDYRLSSEHDTLFSMMGIFSELQQLGDRYVLLGELRGDLMEATDNASLYLKEIQEFNVSPSNPYASKKAYYAVINNCNYTIYHADTTLRNRNDKPMYRIMAAAKSIRAWTYLQLVLNHGSAVYFSKPLISAEDVEKTLPTVHLPSYWIH
jgi:hypothetical protein